MVVNRFSGQVVYQKKPLNQSPPSAQLPHISVKAQSVRSGRMLSTLPKCGVAPGVVTLVICGCVSTMLDCDKTGSVASPLNDGHRATCPASWRMADRAERTMRTPGMPGPTSQARGKSAPDSTPPTTWTRGLAIVSQLRLGPVREVSTTSR